MRPHQITEDVSRDLQVTLNPTEILKHSKELAWLIQERNQVKNNAGEIAASYSAKLKKFDAEIGELSLKVATGREMRPTACYYSYDWDKGFKKIIRRDTYEVLEDMIHISELERQQHLDLQE